MTYQYHWGEDLGARPTAYIETRDEHTARRIAALGKQLETSLKRATGTTKTVIKVQGDTKVSVRATTDGTTNEVLGVILAATALEIDEQTQHQPDDLVRWGYWNDPALKKRTWVARWNTNAAHDPENVIGRSLVNLAKTGGARWLWPGEAHTDDGSDSVERYGTTLDNGESVLVAITSDQEQDLWDTALLDKEIAKRRPNQRIASWRALREIEGGKVEYAIPAPTKCNVTEDLLNVLAQHGCSAVCTTYATATGDQNQGNAGDQPYVIVRTKEAMLGETSRQVEMALITSWHMHQHIDEGNPVNAPRVSVHTNEFMTSDATRRIVSIVLDHSDLMATEGGGTHKEISEMERRRDSAKSVAAQIPSARWLSHTGFTKAPKYNTIMAHNRWLDGIVGIIEEPKHREWANAAEIKAMIDMAINMEQKH